MRTLLSCGHRLVRSIVLVVILSAPVYLKAQWVSIHPTFATYIRTFVDSNAVNGTLLDTTNLTMNNLVNMTMNTNTVTDVNGIRYFKSLQNLNLWTPITTLPQLPTNLKTLDCRSNMLNSFSAGFPTSMQSLKFYYCQFTAIPA